MIVRSKSVISSYRLHTYFVAANVDAVPGWVHNCPKAVPAPNNVTNGLPDNPSQLGHIFRNDVGHLPDTPANRQLLLNTTNNPSNFAGKDRFGNDVYISPQSDGSQVWGYTRNGTIQNGGVDSPPKVWVDGHGLQ